MHWGREKIVSVSAGLLLLLACVWGGWWFLRNNDEAEIRLQVRYLSQIASKPQGEKVLSGALKINRTDKLFAPVCVISAKYEMFSGKFSPQGLTSSLARYRMLFESVRIGISDVTVTLESPEQAVAMFTGELDGRLKSGKSVDEIRDVTCQFVKKDGIWLIDRMEIHEIIEK